MALPANITAESDSNVLTIAASNNKGLLIRFLNEQVEDGFYALVIDYLNLYMAISIRWMWMLQSAHPVFIVTASG